MKRLLLILTLFPVLLLARTDAPKLPDSVVVDILRLQRDTVLLQNQMQQLQTQLVTKSNQLQSLFKSLERDGYNLNPETLVYEPKDEPKKF